jgi:hypothetical protein
MPFLPYSIRGDDYDPDKDESFIMSTVLDNKKFAESIMKDIEESPLNDQSFADIPATYEDTVRNNAFVGPVSFDSIIEGLENQFNDYIDIDDNFNYVDIFYNQLHKSYEVLNDDTETFKEEIIAVIDEYHQKFIIKIAELFNTRLTLTIIDIEDEISDLNSLEFIIRRLYEFFILGAKNNFKVVIANDIKKRIGAPIQDHREYLKVLKAMMIDYSPLITTIPPMDFLKYRGDEEIIQLFEDGKVVGNFLRKYSPKLYKNEEYEVELIIYITMLQQIKEEVLGNDR